MENTAKGKMILLHGILHVDILEADGVQGLFALANRPTQFNKRKRFARRCSWIKRLSSWLPTILPDSSTEKAAFPNATPPAKLYATVDLKNARVGRTRVITTGEAGTNPNWHESFRIYCAHVSENITFTLKSENPIGATLLGRAHLPVTALLTRSSSPVDDWLPICDEDRRPLIGRIHVRVRYESGASDGWKSGIPNTYFKQKTGCRVRLYHDADLDRGYGARIRLAGGEIYRPGRCWEEMWEAMLGAKHLIYVAGWSVYAEVRMLRGEGGEKGVVVLGEMLKRKAGEGVRVMMLVWDDRSSVGELKKDGVMGTHDEDTAEYFRGSGVDCVLCPRNPDIGESYLQGFEIATMFTHHQKTVIVDCAAAVDAVAGRRKGGRTVTTARRRIVSFLGGIDLCDGRYDTQKHSLFRTLAGDHRDDFHQPNFPGAALRKGGPREPWHDVHCRIEGAAAWDVLRNFEQRWTKQGAGEKPLVRLSEIGSVVSAEEEAAAASTGDDSSWNVQIFRSIDGGAAHGFPESPAEAAALGLITGKNNVVDRSIQDAYINAIRRAKNFIYIENQYFLGSSYAWKEEPGLKSEDIGALHLIPKELSLKIASKIAAGERFAVYVVMPMWPEGVPESGSVQAILNWQRRTMEMMYEDVAAALLMAKKGVVVGDLGNKEARDYLNFFCLGNREVKRGGEYEAEERPESGSDYWRAQLERRFMIYVHAKMMIVDDEYIIVGSANINQRSMDGGRDTEIAMGAYQPNHLSSSTQSPARGQIHGFRMSLWYEHLGLSDDAFLRPESRECVLKVRENAERRWQFYLAPQLDNDLPGHLLSYPINVDGYGHIAALPGLEFFPDTKAPVLGARSDRLPAILTT